MKKFPWLYSLCILSIVGGTAATAWAGKPPIKSLRKARGALRSSSKVTLKNVDVSALATAPELLVEPLAVRPLTTPLVRPNTRLPRPPEQLVASFIDPSCVKGGNDIVSGLRKLWRSQDFYGNHQLFPIFIRQYYSQNFGILSPHLQDLFTKIGSLQNRDLEMQVIKRMRYLAMNKESISAALSSTNTKLSGSTLRVRYLADIYQLTAENFREELLVLSVEKAMNPDPERDFPIRHVNSSSEVKIGKKMYPVYMHDVSLDHMANLYRFLLNGKAKHQFITAMFDPVVGSLILFNHNKTLWLRISFHEYSSPEKLHIHLNEIQTVRFTNTYGTEKTEKVNFNLLIPLQAPADFPKSQARETLYQLLVTNPVKFFQGDDHVTVKIMSL